MRGMCALIVLVGCGDNGTMHDARPADGPLVDAMPDADPRTTIAPGAAFVIGTDSPAGRQDEDPAIIIDADGTLVALWYSNRGTVGGGPLDKQIYSTRSIDGATWSAPAKVSDSAAGTDWSFAPSVTTGPTGSLVAAWWNVHLTPDGCTPMVDCTGTRNTLFATTSPDGRQWDPPEQVTTGAGDWLPSVVYDASGGRTLVYFAAVARRADATVDFSQTTSRLFVTVKTGTTWGAVTPLTGVDAANTHQSYPFVVRKADGTYLMTWTRWATTSGGGALDVLGTATTETVVATSTDGIAWSDARVVSEGAGAFVDVFPTLHSDRAQTAWSVTWETTDGAAMGHTIELPIAGTYPADRVLRPELAGYTPRALATATPGVYWGVFVDGSDPTQRVRGRFFTK